MTVGNNIVRGEGLPSDLIKQVDMPYFSTGLGKIRYIIVPKSFFSLMSVQIWDMLINIMENYGEKGYEPPTTKVAHAI